MNLLGVACDKGPTDLLLGIQTLLMASGPNIVYTIFGGEAGEIDSSDGYIKSMIEKCRAVIIGVSSSPKNAEKELLTLKFANEMERKSVIICDVPLVFQRPWLVELVNEGFAPDLLFVTSREEVSMASSIYPNKTAIGVYNPFEKWFFVDRGDTRRVEIKKSLGIENDNDILLVNTDKEISLTITLLDQVIEASFGLPINVVISLHPGLGANRQAVYDYVKYYETGSKGFMTKKANFVITEISSTEILPFVNLLICVPGSTLGGIASCLRIPVASPYYWIYDGSLLEKVGTNEWPYFLSGANVYSFLSEELIITLLDKTNYGNPSSKSFQMFRAQEREFPRPDKPGQAVENAVNEILALME